VVVAVSYDDPRGVFDNFGDDRELVSVGRSHRKTSDHSRPADPHVYPKALEGLLEEGIFAESSLPFEARAAMGSGEHRQAGKGKESQMAKVGS
jgi:hypothetical protein